MLFGYEGFLKERRVKDEALRRHKAQREDSEAEISERNLRGFPVAMRAGDTPVPIPNTTVKTRAADGTMLETAWESRWLPEPL